MFNLKNFSAVRVLVIGDLMLDKYLWGDVSRISPEAPVPVVLLKKTNYVLGGAANVAVNAASLGAQTSLIGVIGNDPEGKIFAESLKQARVDGDFLVKSENRPTTVKTRIIAHNQQIVRLDQESTESITAADEEFIGENFSKKISQTDVLIISDYAKGVLTKNLTARLITQARAENKLILIDPKGRDYSKYQNATAITPNKLELAEVSGCNIDNTDELILSAEKLREELNLQTVIVTRGEQGVTVIEKENQKTYRAITRKVYDVTGAGDTFIAALGVAIGAGNTLQDSAQIANFAAGLAVETVGTTAITNEELRLRINNTEL